MGIEKEFVYILVGIDLVLSSKGPLKNLTLREQVFGIVYVVKVSGWQLAQSLVSYVNVINGRQSGCEKRLYVA